MRLGFTGTREGINGLQRVVLRKVLWTLKPSEVHHGDCVGADAEFHDLAAMLPDIRIHIHPCNISSMRAYKKGFETHAVEKPLFRNCQIVDSSDWLIACPKEMTEQDRGGTWYTVKYARAVKCPTLIIFPDGSAKTEIFCK